MWNYLKYIFKLYTGLLVIIALDSILKKADVKFNDWWFYTTLIFYNAYCYIEFRLSKDDE